MKFARSPSELIALFDRVAPDGRGIQRRQMFGYPSCFANGNMFTGLFADRMFVRLDAAGREELVSKGGRIFEPTEGRPMREYVEIPETILRRRALLESWIERSLKYASSLPPKAPKRKAARKKTGARKATSKPRAKKTARKRAPRKQG